MKLLQTLRLRPALARRLCVAHARPALLTAARVVRPATALVAVKPPAMRRTRALATAATAPTRAPASFSAAAASADTTATDDAAAAAAAAAAGPSADGSLTAETDVRDPELIFATVWKNLTARVGEDRLVFPKEIMFLAGAPGAGKGVMTPFIMSKRGFTAKPIEVSSLLRSPEAERLKAAGHLVGDRQVFELLLEALLEPRYASGVIVDGFPRTPIQAECIDRLYKAMHELRAKFAHTPHGDRFRRPIFHITVLFIDENESVRRQMSRGQADVHHNAIVAQTGVGRLRAVRATDSDPALARERYAAFKNQVYDSLKLLKEKFHFHFIDAAGPVDDVKARVMAELTYQSAMELNDDTLGAVRQIPLASDMTKHARHALVKRLDDYTTRAPALVSDVVALIQTDFVRILQQQALQGKAIIRSVSPLLAKPMALDILLDIMAERGYSIVLDLQKTVTARSYDAATGKFILVQDRLWEFQLSWPRPAIRLA